MNFPGGSVKSKGGIREDESTPAWVGSSAVTYRLNAIPLRVDREESFSPNEEPREPGIVNWSRGFY
jgi:hypothetical protein